MAARVEEESVTGAFTEETRVCPRCGKRMIKRYEPRVLASYPPQYPWFWWCKCGHTEEGGIDRGMTNEEVYERLWEEANR